jgi:hypothetical protein
MEAVEGIFSAGEELEINLPIGSKWSMGGLLRRGRRTDVLFWHIRLQANRGSTRLDELRSLDLQHGRTLLLHFRIVHPKTIFLVKD